MTREEAISKLNELIECTVDRNMIDDICYEIIEFLETHEPRVMTLEEVKSLKQDAVVWYEHTGINGPHPRIVHYADDRCIVFTDGGKWQYDADGYSSLWRCWTSRPTDAQREAIPWEQ